MLKEISAEQLPAPSLTVRGPGEEGKFAEETVLEFAASDMGIAEVCGWPDGNSKDKKAVKRRYAMLRSKVKKHKLRDIAIMQRGMRMFLVRKNVEGE